MFRLSGKKFLSGLGNVAAILAVAGCQASTVIAASESSSPAKASVETRRLIIKFRPDTIACDAEGIAQISVATKLTLEYVRSMSGNSCVIRQLSSIGADFMRGQELLRQHPAVEWLEQDAKMKAL